jgi:hypothetical protein
MIRLHFLLVLIVLLGMAGSTWAAPTSSDAPALSEPNNADHGNGPAPHMAPLTVAVLPFDSKDKGIGMEVAEAISVKLSEEPSIQLVEREQLDRILDEHKLSLSAITQPSEAARIGWLAGAKVLVFGRAYTLDEQLLITARIVGVETSRVFISQVRSSTKEDLLPALDRLAERVRQDIIARRKLLVAPDISNDKDKLFDSLISQLKGKKLPKVVVTIPETHYGAAAVDPAAETEMILWLTKCGFAVNDQATLDQSVKTWARDMFKNNGTSLPSSIPEDIDVVIIGEAFSEGAGRFGDIMSAKARIELRVLDRKTGAIIAIARRTASAVDLSERIAAKKALQDAALNIAYDVIPKIAGR